jgi:hypothetical protein
MEYLADFAGLHCVQRMLSSIDRARLYRLAGGSAARVNAVPVEPLRGS